jgi:hypothetical protein
MTLKSKLHPCPIAVAAVALSVTLLRAQTVAYTWLGASSDTWALAANWSGSAFPNSATDSATIDLATNNPVQIDTAILLGGSTNNSLTIGDNAAPIGLHIALNGSLTLTGATAGIVSNKAITVEGLLIASYSPSVPIHHPPPPLSIYPVTGTGGISLAGGTIEGAGTKGAWDIGVPLSGFGTLSNRVYISNTVTVDDNASITIAGGVSLAGGTLAANGNGYYNNQGSIGGYGTIAAPLNPGGSIPNSGGVTTIAASISGGCRIGHETETDVGRVTLTGTGGSHINFDNDSGPVNLTGDVVFSGYVDIGSNGSFNLNGRTITLTYGPDAQPPVVSIISAVNVGTGTIDNATTADLDFSQGPYNFAGGSLTSTGGGAFIRGGIYGWGTISAPIVPCGSAAIVSANSSGHALRVLNTVLMTTPTINGNLIATAGGILELGPGSVLTTGGPANFTGYVSPGSGVVILNGTNIAGGTGPIRLNTGAVNVVSDSTLGGPIDCAASLTISPGARVSISGGTATVSLSGGSLANKGTLSVGAGHLTNATANEYPLVGAGTISMAGGTVTGANGFSSDNTLEGFGEVDGPYANTGTVAANVAGGTLVMTGAGAGTLVNAPVGILEATGGGTLSFSNASALSNQGTIIAAASSTVQAQGGPLVLGTGILSGSGTVIGDVLNAAGTVSPGASFGLTVQGVYTQGAQGTYQVEVAGPAGGSSGPLAVTGNAALDGTLAVHFLAGYTPAVGDSYRILDATGTSAGTFASVSVAGAPAGFGATVVYDSHGATLLITRACGSADFNGDGDIGTDADIEAFFACLAGSCCATCGSADFNGDGDTGTDADIESFFRVLAGGSC